MSALHTKTISELSSLLAAGEASSVELTADVIAAIDAGDARIGSYVEMNKKQALISATAADARRAAGENLPLLGIPIGAKDLLNVKGQGNRCASKLLDGYTSPYTATSVARLEEQGAVILGRMNMDEFAMGGSNENSAIQPCRNPWDTTRVPGGSSGGSAAAVAADLAVATLGSDTGGSIRQPAAFCGCVGLKPTYGMVSRFGLTAFASSLDQIGPLTKTVADTATVLQAISGHDPKDSTSLKVDVPDYSQALKTDVKGMRIGVPTDYFSEGLDADVETAVRAALATYESMGAELVDVSLPHSKYAIAAYYVIATAEASANLARFDGVRYGARVDGDNPVGLVKGTRAAGFGPEVKRRIILGTYVLSSGYYDAYYIKAQKVRGLIRKDFDEAFEKCDVIAGPCTPTPAFPIGEKSDDPLQMYLGDMYTVPANLAGICGMSLPCGFSSGGMPIGLQLMGPSFGESALLHAGHAFEQATEFHRARPATSTEAS